MSGLADEKMRSYLDRIGLVDTSYELGCKKKIYFWA